MKNLALATSLLAATSLFSLANAASGVINFTGSLNAASCSVNGGGDAPGTPSAIAVAMGSVSIDELSDGTGTDFGNETSIPIDIDCSNAGGMKTVAMRFAPYSGSGVDAVDGRLLKIKAGGTSATGVGIGLIDSDNKLIDMSGTAESKPVDLEITKGEEGAPDSATAKLMIRAAYIKAVAGADVPVPGDANGTLPFTLTYK